MEITRNCAEMCLGQQILDVSSAASVQDLKPNRFTVMVNSIKVFIREFFDQNPLSQLGILLMKNGQAEKLSDLSSSPVSGKSHKSYFAFS